MSRQAIQKNWFLICLVVALTGGAFLHTSLSWAKGTGAIRWAIVAITMFVMAWPLRFDAIVQVFRNPRAPLFAALINLGVLPLLAWPLSGLLDHDLGVGLLVAAATPCTLASAAVWTRKAGGNDAVAMIVSVLTNATCFITLPFWLWVTLDSNEATISFTDIAIKLLCLVFLPILIAQCSRSSKRVANWATDNKKPLSVIAQIGILIIVLMGSIQTGEQMSQVDLSGQIGLLILGAMIVIGIHCATLTLGYFGGRMLNMDQGDRIAVAFAGSQKTLMVGLSASLDLGVSILPIVAYHAFQLIIDTVIANRWGHRADESEEKSTVVSNA